MSVTACNRKGDAAEGTVSMVVHECPVCGVFYALSERFRNHRKNNGDGWYCPNGHWLAFTTTEVDRLKEQAQRNKEQSEMYRRWYESSQSDLKHERQSKRAIKGQVTKLKKRVAHGVCPCCTRHFTNLERHMATKHPDFVIDKEDGS